MAEFERADALVLFGATGDLARRKLFPALYQLERHKALDIAVIGVARSDWDDERFREHARAAIEKACDTPDPEVVDRLVRRFRLVGGDYSSHETFSNLARTLAEVHSNNAVFYLPIPPSAFPTITQSLANVGLNRRGRVVVEKPFGRDLESARELNRVLHEAFPEDRIFRIDHYLGKESVEDLLVFRFSNSLLEPIWNRNHVSSVQVTMAERIGVEGRGAFYDSVGAIRDVVQNHLLQVVTLLAMEPPVGPDSRHLQDEKAKVLMAMRSIDPAWLVKGQYRGYLDEPGVAAGSTTETFAAARLEIDSWRWAGVPFYVRAGKALAENATEAVIELKEPPRLLFDEIPGPPPERNLIRFRLGNNDGVTLTVQAKTPGDMIDSQPVDLSVDFAAALGERKEAYERLLGDAIAGNPRRFARQDIVEETWRIVQPVLDQPGIVHVYERGSWGPPQANALLQQGTYWHDPVHR
ncbi:MAG TPA: glucose-6-phosphate dehydrogenase [Acidimicrobiales bacterium]|nr:glucose-6-phosphate dehydrogenase [Acidimicrobiales bacterium]